AALAAEERASFFCVGSELAWADGETASWKDLIARVRSVFPGKLAYSANWDDYEAVTFWEEIDLLGVTGYNELASASGASDRARAFFYEWWGEGGPLDSRYTPRGKPAEELIRRFFDDIRFVERSR